MDLVYHKIFGLRDIIEENPSTQIYDNLPITKSTAITWHCPLPPPSTLFGEGERLKNETVQMEIADESAVMVGILKDKE